MRLINTDLLTPWNILAITSIVFFWISALYLLAPSHLPTVDSAN